MNGQTNTQKYLEVLRPSGLGSVLYVSLAGLLMVLHQSDSIRQYLEIPSDIELLQSVKSFVELLLTGLLGQSRTETVVVGLFWAAVGLAVYLFLQGLIKILFDLGQSIQERSYIWPQGSDRNRQVVRHLQRIGFQAAALLAVMWWFLRPLARVLNGPVLTDLIGTSTVMQYLVWFVTIVLSLHVLVVLLRLVVLRMRLIG